MSFALGLRTRMSWGAYFLHIKGLNLEMSSVRVWAGVAGEPGSTA
jgi:hypothetical protein